MTKIVRIKTQATPGNSSIRKRTAEVIRNIQASNAAKARNIPIKTKQRDSQTPAFCDGQVSTTSIGTKLWLVKLPPALSQKWAQMPPSAKLGTLDLGSEKDAMGRQVPKIIDETGEEYIMTHVRPAPLFVMERQGDVTKGEGSKTVPLNPESAQINVAGIVDSMFHMRPQHMQTQLSRTRKISEVSNAVVNTTKRATVSMPESRRYIEAQVKNQMAQSAEERREEKLLRQRQKAVKEDRDKVERALLALFEKQPFWSFRELKEETKQPEDHLRSILKEIAVYIPNGEHRTKWQLKEQYRTHAPEEGDNEEWQ
eukprot:CAMPEP_0117448696 /NCGR_PEP_ID=MMETSP0759-20121206/7542_1 /TAXON_ID=63605 /ORGANISM="Percolomonas cosmopolitus, Strain WS" /LENGTH=311 /DNA_ID=CAMNT_0005241107 /DNA_START=89 /DNA_END=1027 /DNA_ORIENTATION=-